MTKLKDYSLNKKENLSTVIKKNLEILKKIKE